MNILLEKNYYWMLEIKVCLHEYKKPKYQLAVEEFFYHCDEGPYIDLDNDL